MWEKEEEQNALVQSCSPFLHRSSYSSSIIPRVVCSIDSRSTSPLASFSVLCLGRSYCVGGKSTVACALGTRGKKKLTSYFACSQEWGSRCESTWCSTDRSIRYLSVRLPCPPICAGSRKTFHRTNTVPCDQSDVNSINFSIFTFTLSCGRANEGVELQTPK